MKYFLLSTLLFLASCSLLGGGDTTVTPTPTQTPPLSTVSVVTLSTITQISWGTRARLKDNSLTLTETGVTRMMNGTGLEYPFSKEAWTTLISDMKLDEYTKLDEQFGCPGCADGEVEWIEIIYGTGSKKITFEVKDTIPAIAAIRRQLRRIDTLLATSEPIIVSHSRFSGTGADNITGIFWGINPGFGATSCEKELRISTVEIIYTIRCYGQKDIPPQIFTGSLNENEWDEIHANYTPSDFSGLTTAPPAPDSSSITLEITHNGKKEQYIIGDYRTVQNGKVGAFFDHLRKLAESLQNPNSSQSHSILKIERSISGMFGSVTTTVTPEKVTIKNDGRGEANNTTKEGSISNEQWTDLKESIHMEKFLKLNQKDPRFKCKACTSNGENMESLEITYEGGSKKLGFRTASNIPEFDALESQLSELSKKATNTPESGITSIEWGISFGMCAGYCFNSITFSPGNITERKTSYDETENPTIIKKYPLENKSWVNLLSKINLEKFNSLPDRIGCPDCADGGAEWVKIKAGGTTKNVIFEYKKSIPEIDELRKIIQILSQELSKKGGSISKTGNGHK